VPAGGERGGEVERDGALEVARARAGDEHAPRGRARAPAGAGPVTRRRRAGGPAPARGPAAARRRSCGARRGRPARC
jgi:hypothetical protein